jgi:lipooligosaccharide transport system permease protein
MALASTFRVTEGHARVYRRTWRGSVISTFLNPILFLLAMGVGLGSLVDDGGGTASLDLPYLTFLAPGLLAATAMQTGVGDSAWPVMAGIKWRKTYQATLATPVGVEDVVTGQLAWVGVRLTFVTVVYSVVMSVFGATDYLDGLLAVPPAVLTGLAFSAPMIAYTATLKSEAGLSTMFRFVVLPLFLFSGTFFPIEQLPEFLQPIAWVVPLWHGVSLCRGLALGIPFEAPPAASVAYLLAWLVGGTILAIRQMRKRLVI